MKLVMKAGPGIEALHGVADDEPQRARRTDLHTTAEHNIESGSPNIPAGFESRHTDAVTPRGLSTPLVNLLADIVSAGAEHGTPGRELR